MNRIKVQDGKMRMIDLVNKVNELVDLINSLDNEVEAISRIVYEKIETEDLDS